ncbi:MAG TPA: 2Fe-2S iron-sulfur cluster-binding protein, partial [Xanthomonadales bacterium]|nr:2Fe-2S iron-sulfur cluster-binding protein [Xanthomonadales bacterium]
MMYESQPDLGTPAPAQQLVELGEPVSLTIDGRNVTVSPGTSVMRAAALAGIKVPKLCATDSLDAFGSCRVCLVEIEGRKGYPASCTTEVAAEMEVRTQSEHLTMLRRNVLELYVSDHSMDGGPTSQDCELQELAGELGITKSRYSINGHSHQDAAIDDSNPYFVFDPSKCIVCYRCVRACDDIQGTFALSVDGRGFESRIIAGQDDGFMQSDCVSCGACVDNCPTEALQEKSILELGLPERDVLTTCAYCGVGC